MIQFVKGDFFDYKADVRVNTVNCVGVMGAGVAKIFKGKYPQMFKEYARICRNGEIKPEKPHVWENREMFGENLTVINLPTKLHWRNPSQYEYIEKGLDWLKKFLENKANTTITIPALGCGHGGLDWTVVRKMIADKLSALQAKILVFEPKSSTSTAITEELQKELHEKGIKSITPGSPSYPEKLKGKSAQELFLKGDSNIFKSKIIAISVDSKANEREKKAVIQCIEELTKHDELTFSVGLNSSFETDLLKELLIRKAKILLTLPYGILMLKIRKDLQNVWDDNLITLVSLSHPRQSWKSYEGIKAYKFRLKTADATMIANMEYDKLCKFEKDIGNNNSVFYINYGLQSSSFLNRIYAKKIGRSPSTFRPNVSPLIESLRLEQYST